jgi:hypothetical protein
MTAFFFGIATATANGDRGHGTTKFADQIYVKKRTGIAVTFGGSLRDTFGRDRERAVRAPQGAEPHTRHLMTITAKMISRLSSSHLGHLWNMLQSDSLLKFSIISVIAI